jgi:hypothetical protein
MAAVRQNHTKLCPYLTKTHHSSITNTMRLIPFRQITSIYRDKHTNHTKTESGRNVEYFNVTEDGS